MIEVSTQTITHHGTSLELARKDDVFERRQTMAANFIELIVMKDLKRSLKPPTEPQLARSWTSETPKGVRSFRTPRALSAVNGGQTIR